MNLIPFGKKKSPLPPIPTDPAAAPRITKIGFGGVAILISYTREGPMILPAQSTYHGAEPL